MQCLACLEGGWNGLEKSTCVALFLNFNNGEDGVTVMFQGVGWFTCKVRKLREAKGLKTHEWNGRFNSQVRNGKFGSLVCNF